MISRTGGLPYPGSAGFRKNIGISGTIWSKASTAHLAAPSSILSTRSPTTIVAEFENGVLHVSVKKEEERKNRHKIEINSRKNQSANKAGAKNVATANNYNGSAQAKASGNDKAETKPTAAKAGKSIE